MLPCFRTDDKKEDPCVTYNPYMSIGTPAALPRQTNTKRRLLPLGAWQLIFSELGVVCIVEQ